MFGFSNMKAQQYQIYNNQVVLQNVKCEQKGDQLYLSMNVNAGKADVSSRKALVLTPVIKNNEMEKELPCIVVSGKNRYKADKRAKHFKAEIPYETSFITMENDEDALVNINYYDTLPYEPWMETAYLEIKEETYACAACKKSDSRDSITKVQPEYIEPHKPEGKPVLSYIQPEAEAVKNRNMTGSAYLDFPVGKSEIITDFRNNFKELSKIHEAINSVKDDPNAIINSISLEGFASPDGNYTLNERLSKERSNALKNYLQKEYEYSDNMFLINSVAEDWVGLKKLVEDSNLTYRNTILDIINNNTSYDVKEQSLKQIKNGVVYKELLDEYFPQLRRVNYKLDYTIKAFSIEEGKEIIKTKPGQLSLNEMFLIANTYPKGSEEFNRVFDIAVRMFPKDTIANLNAAATILEKGHAAFAHTYLDPYQQVPQSWNNQGVMYLLEGNYSKAKDFLTKAETQGVSEASSNLDLLDKLQLYKMQKDEYDAAIKKQ